MGSVVISPMLYTYYCWLDSKFPGKKARTIGIKVANDILIANVAYYSTFYYGMSYLEHKNHNRAKKDLQNVFGLSYLAGMVYWGPIMALNFAYVHRKFRVVFIALASFVETNGLCLMRRRVSD